MQQPWLSRVSRSLGLLVGLICITACGAADPTAVQFTPLPPLEHGIIDGTRSSTKDYPATGVILFKTQRYDGTEFGSMLCTGTLVQPDVVMVAAHCDLALFVPTDTPVNYYFSRTLDVSDFGQHHAGLPLPPATTKVAKMVPHPDFSLDLADTGLTQTNDIALLYLEEAVTDVKPASLIRADESRLLHKNAAVAIVGYGRRHNDHRRRLDAGIKYHGLTRINRLGRYEMQISAGAPQPHTCHGDSGGPTFLKIGKRLALIGITSHAYDEEDCLHGGVDTRVDAYLPWITSTLKAACEDGTRPACRARYAWSDLD